MKDDPRTAPTPPAPTASATATAHQAAPRRTGDDLTALGRWVERGMDQGSRFWLLLIGTVAALAVVAYIASGWETGKAAESEAWVQLVRAKTGEEKSKVADEFPKSPVAEWARLQVALEEYQGGLDDLITPGRRETAGPKLKKALDLFLEVAKNAPKKSQLAIGAAFGAARAMEARNELADAKKQYELVAREYPDSPEGKQAVGLAKVVGEPDAAQFYSQFYAYRAPTGTGPGVGNPSLPGMIPGFGAAPGSTATPKSFLPDILKNAGPTDIDAPPPPVPTPSPAAAPATPTSMPSPAAPPQAEATSKVVPPPAPTPGGPPTTSPVDAPK